MKNLSIAVTIFKGVTFLPPFREAGSLLDYTAPMEQVEKYEAYCNATFDQFLCWPPTKAGTNVTLHCPPEVPFVDPKNLAMRICGDEGLWLDQNMESSATGWTDYISCFPPYVRDLLENMTKSKDPNSKFTVAGWIRSIEFVGISLSILALASGITIFKKFRSLLNKRTRIHLHLFSVLLCQCVVLLSIYVDQETSRLMAKNDMGCKVMYTVVEFLTTHCFCFMLIEGLYLYSTINANALRPRLSYRMCLAFAYIWPILNTSVWVGTAISRYELEEKVRCWFGYNLDKIFWILQGPRLAIIVFNFLLLLAVLRILMTKMSQNRTTDLERVKKALRATMLLMPLLGITNFLSMTNGPVRESTLKFALWALFAYVFRSFQGFLIVYIYCFRNAEVHDVLKNYMMSKRNARNYSVRGRTNVTETECEVFRRDGEGSRLASLIPDAEIVAPADAAFTLAQRSSIDQSDSEKAVEEIELTTFSKVSVKPEDTADNEVTTKQ